METIKAALDQSSSSPDVSISTQPLETALAHSKGNHSRLRLGLLLVLILCVGIAAGFGMGRMRDNGRAIVVSINGSDVRAQDFYHRLEVAAGPAVLRQMMAEKLTLQFAEKTGVQPTDAEIEAKLAEARKQPDFAQNLANSNQTSDDVKYSLRVNSARAAIINKGVNVTDAEVRAFYDAQSDKRNPDARYYMPETVSIAVIVTATEADAQQALHALASGQPFASVALKYSKDKSASLGGRLPPVRRGQTDPHKFPGLEKLIFNLKVGQQIDLAQFAGAWWIIRCIDKTAETRVPFEKVKDECRTGAMLAKGLLANSPSIQAEFDAFQRDADIKVFWPQYKETAKLK